MRSILEIKDIRSVLSKNILIRPKLNAVKLLVKTNKDKKCEIYRNDSNTPIDEIVLCINTIYEKAYNHFTSLNLEKFNEDLLFVFDYFPDETFNEEYRPAKSLFYLNHIREGNIVITSEKLLKFWSTEFKTDYVKPLFRGVLTEEKRENLIKHLHKNLIYDLMKSEYGIDYKVSDVIISSGEDAYKVVIENQLFESNTNTDYNQIIISEFAEFVNQNQAIGNSKLQILENYFLRFIKSREKLIEGLDYSISNTFGHSRYKINAGLIGNITLLNLLLDNTVYENLYQVILGYFSKPFKKPKGLIDNLVLENLNKSISKIENHKQQNTMKTYKDLKLESSVKSTPKQRIYEGLKLHTRQQGEEEVNIMVGRFQPFTNGHIKVAEQIHKSNGLPVVILAVNSGKVSEKTPFTTGLIEEAFTALQGEFSFLQDLFFVKNASIVDIFNDLRPEYEPVIWGCGEDRYDSYNYMVTKYRAEANLLSKFTIDKVERQDSDVSATQVRSAIEANNKEEFEELTPASIHFLWDEFRKEIIVDDKEETSESLASLHQIDEEFIKRSIRKGIILEKRKRRKKNPNDFYSKIVMRNLKYRPFFYGGHYNLGVNSDSSDSSDGGDAGGGASESLSESFINYKEDLYSIPKVITENLKINEACDFKIDAKDLIKEGIVLDENRKEISSFRNRIEDKETVLSIYGLEHLIRKVNSLGDAKNSSNFYEILFEKMLGGISGNIKGQSDSIFYDVQVMNEYVSVKSSSSARTAYNAVLNKSVTKLNQYYNFILNKGLNLGVKDRIIENSLKILIERLSTDTKLLTWLNDREYGILHYLIESNKLADPKQFDFDDFVENFKYEIINLPEMYLSIASFYYPTTETLSYRKTTPSSLIKINKGLNKIILDRMQEDKASNKVLFLTSRKNIDCLFENFKFHSVDFVFSPVEHQSIVEMKKNISKLKSELIYSMKNDPSLQANGEFVFNEEHLKKIILGE